MLGNDTDADGDPLTAALVSATGQRHAGAERRRQLHLHAERQLQRHRQLHLPGERRHGGLERRDRDDHGRRAVNDAPVAVDDGYATTEDTPLTVAAPGVLGNDTDVDGDPLTAVLVSGPANGTLTLNADGGFTYTPNANFNGTRQLHLQASDGTADSNAATVDDHGRRGERCAGRGRRQLQRRPRTRR